MEHGILLDTAEAATFLGVAKGFLIHNRRTAAGPQVTWVKTGAKFKCRYKADDLRLWADDPVAGANRPERAPPAVPRAGAGRPRGSASKTAKPRANQKQQRQKGGPRSREGIRPGMATDELRRELGAVVKALMRLLDRL